MRARKFWQTITRLRRQTSAKPTGLGSATVRSRNAFAGVVYKLGFLKLHAGYGDTRLSALGDADIRNTLLGITVPVPTGAVIASWP